MTPLTKLMQQARISLRYAPSGKLLRRLGVTSLARQFYIKRVLMAGSSEAQVLGQTLRFKIDSDIEIMRVDTIGRELDFLKRMTDSLRSGDVFYDVGANIGTVALLLAKVCPDARVLAFEPEPRNAQRLRENIELNSTANVAVCETALAATTGTLTFHIQGDTGTGTHSLVHNGPGGETIEVATITGQQFITEGGTPPNGMKIDVEGAELDVLRGFDRALSSPDLRNVFIEVHPTKLAAVGSTPQHVHDLISGHGYELIWSSGRGGEEHRHYARRPN